MRRNRVNRKAKQ